MSTRSRIEGTLHRSLPATLTIREAEPGHADDGLLRLRLSFASEIEYLRAGWWEEPWIEILGHNDDEVDLSRLNGGASVLANHDRITAVGNTPLASIGATTKAWLEARRSVCDLTISRREALSDLRQDIADDLVHNVSVGYIINERVLVKAGTNGTPSTYRVTSWTPYEISLVDIPADASVGLGRAADGIPTATPSPTRQPGYRVIDLPPAEGKPTTTERTRSMGDEVKNSPADGNTTATANPANTVTNGSRSIDPLAGERERVREITALGRQFNIQAEADSAVDSGASLDAFRQLVLAKQVDSGKLRKAESPEIGMSKKDVENFSFCRALLAASDPVNAAKLAPFEMEASRAAQDKRGDSRDKSREAALTIPVDVLRSGINLPAGVSAAAMRHMQAHSMQRDLMAGTPTAGGNTVTTEYLGSSFIELLRNAMVLDRMGITWLRDLNGNLVIPSQTGSASYYWVAEGGSPTESQQTTGQIGLTPKTIGAFTDYSRRLLLQSSLDVEAFVRADIAAIIGQGIQSGAFFGAGASNEPLGLFNTSGIGSVAGGVNGGAPTYDLLVDLETAVDVGNANVGNLSYLTNSKVRGKLRKTQEFASTNGKAVWTRGSERGVGDVLGYDAWVTNALPSNLVKGTASNCSPIAFGNWADLIVGMWGGLDIMLDPYTGATSGTRRVVALQDVDVAVRQVASFAAMKDALTN